MLGVLGCAYYRAADVGAVFAIADQIEDGNTASAFAALTKAAARVKAEADAALAAGHRTTASEAYMQSSNYGFAATYFCDAMGAPEKIVPTWALSRAAMDTAFRLFKTPVEHVRIPYQGTTLPGYFFSVDRTKTMRPLLLLTNGSDGSVLDLWMTAAAGIDRGYNCLAVDGPGQGAALWRQHLYFRPDWEHVVTPTVDFALKRPEVDPKRIAIQGISQGGYWVPRAVAFEHRIAAAIADPGVVDVVTSWTAKLPPALMKVFAAGNRADFDRFLAEAAKSPVFAFRARPYGSLSPFDLFTALQSYKLASVVKQIRCPVLVTSPDGEAFWPDQSQQLYAELPGPKKLVPFTTGEGGELHCEPLATGLRTQRVFDWLDEVLDHRR